MDCRALLQRVAQAEAATGSSCFGHPDPPQLLVRGLRHTPTAVVVAYTERTVVVQAMNSTTTHEEEETEESSSEPLLVCQLGRRMEEEDAYENNNSNKEEDDIMDERITALGIVVLDEDENDDTTRKKNAETPPATPVHKDNPSDSPTHANATPESITHTTSLMTGTVFTAPGVPGKDAIRLAIVLGTTASRLYAVELRLAGTQIRHAAVLSDPSSDDDEEEEDEENNYLYQVFPADPPLRKRRRTATTTTTTAPWNPHGGVLNVHVQPTRATIIYGDGNLLRVAPAALLPSTWRAAADQSRSVEDWVGQPLWRGQVLLPPPLGGRVWIVVGWAPPAMAPFQTTSTGGGGDDTVQALVLAASSDGEASGGGGGMPTLCFYASAPELESTDGDSKDEDDDDEKEADDTATLPDNASVRSVASSFMGALRWGLGSGPSRSSTTTTTNTTTTAATNAAADPPESPVPPPAATCPFPSLSKPPIPLYAYQEIHDPPRAITSCTIDPTGRYVAACDCLGRILLIDMTTQQLVRLWKGYRDGTCAWLGHRCLVLHSRLRRTVELWRHQQRVAVRSVGADTRLVPGWPQCCLWLGGSGRLEAISTTTTTTASEALSVAPSVASHRTGTSRRSTQRLQHLQQLLSSDTLQYTKETVRQALQEIRSLADLATALDLLAEGRVLEESLGVRGAEFQKECLAYSRGVLHAALNRGRGDVEHNPHVQLLQHKLEYHTQVRAYAEYTWACVCVACASPSLCCFC